MTPTPPALMILIALALPACAPAPAPVPAPVLAPAPGSATAPAAGADMITPGQAQAFFASEPLRLFDAARAACTGPGQRPVTPAPGVLRCESLPGPGLAASLILSFGGTVAAIPVHVVSFTSRPRDGGHVVTADSYVVVPQPGGSLREVRLPDPRVSAAMADLLAAAGGRPL